MEKKAPLNRTLTLTKQEIKFYKNNLINTSGNVNLNKITNKIIKGNIFEVLDFLPGNFVDLLFIDPPYNLNKKFNTGYFKKMKLPDYEGWIDSWLGKIVRLLKPNASVYICGDWKSSSAVFNVAIKYFEVRNRITWEREKGRGAKYNWKNCSEDIWFCTKSGKYNFNTDAVKIKRRVLAPYRTESGKPKDWAKQGDNNYRVTHPSNIWTDITVPFWSMPENTNHPTQKPEKLLAKIILASSRPGDFVFDPFLGSGTTAVVAKKLERKFSGIEAEELYCCLTEKRLALADSDNAIQGYEDGIFWERNSLSERKKKKK